jgi:hypothetical protein
MRISRTALILVSVFLIYVGMVHGQSAGSVADWRLRLSNELPLLGHRNWIAVVDSAYPLQTSAGIETVEINTDHLDVVRTVLDQLSKTKHVWPVIFTDAELAAVPESEAAGVTAYREALSKVLGAIFAARRDHCQTRRSRQDVPHPSAQDQSDNSLHVGVHPPGLRLLERRAGETAAGEDAEINCCGPRSYLISVRKKGPAGYCFATAVIPRLARKAWMASNAVSSCSAVKSP